MRVRILFVICSPPCTAYVLRVTFLGIGAQIGGKFHLKLNMGSKPIANKYHEGKMKRTLKRELKVPELAERKADGTSVAW